MHGVAVMAHAVQQGSHHGTVTEEVVPLVIAEIGGNESWPMAVALLHQFEEDIGLFGCDVDVAQFVDEEHIESGQAVEEFTGGAICERSVHFVEQILGADELATIAILECFEQDHWRGRFCRPRLHR